MKIILVATDAKGKNVVFVSNALRAYSLDEAVRLAKEGKFENVYVVQGRSGAYLRSRQSVSAREQLEHLSVSSRQLFKFANDIGSALSYRALNQYLQLYELALKRQESQPFLAIGGIAKITKRKAREKLQEHAKLIFDAAENFGIDPHLLAAIITDELARFLPLEDLLGKLAVFSIGKDVSAGVAQVKVETARGLIQDRYYNPNPKDPRLASERIGKIPRKDLYEYVKQAEHSIHFAAAHMRALVDHWKRFVDLSKRPEIIATLYSIGRGKPPHRNPQPSERGLQIVREFYPLAKVWIP